MTFFNKKTEVMQIEMTPYGRYLYSIGKFKPHSYEFVDDDILYKASGSTEAQEDIHQRILNETPKLKINRAFQKEDSQVASPPLISDKRIVKNRMTQRQNSLHTLGRSSYSSDNIPSLQITMLQGRISGSSNVFETSSSYGRGEDKGGNIDIPQVNVEFVVNATLNNELFQPSAGKDFISETFSDGNYIELSFIEPIIHLKEFNSFYEKENFEFEVFVSSSIAELIPLKMIKKRQFIENDLLMVDENMAFDTSLFDEDLGDDYLQYYFDIEVDSEIPQEDLCRAVDTLEINNQFLDEELICPDQRNRRFDIYATRVGPEDLEDCDD